jgi:hypothetical protein
MAQHGRSYNMPTKVKGTTGVDKIEAGAVITNPEFSGNATVTGSMTVGGVNVFSGPYRNLIINGDMRIDQRNAGASHTSNNSNVYTLDRYTTFETGGTTGKFTVQQNAGAVTPPSGFGYYLGITSQSAFAVTSGIIQSIAHKIEGYNTAHLNWGTANAKTITLSFWVRSSLTGTFGGVISNGAVSYSYPFTYTISSANTWEYKTVTIDGPTAGTWIGATNGIGLVLQFVIGTGSTYNGTAGSWSANGYYGVTGAINVTGTSGATLYITGVQLEVGSGASDFEFLPYDVQLLRCLRYFNYIAGSNTHGMHYGGGGNSLNDVFFTVPMRATPTATYTSGSVGSSFNVQDNKKGYVFQGNSSDTYLTSIKLSAEL